MELAIVSPAVLRSCRLLLRISITMPPTALRASSRSGLPATEGRRLAILSQRHERHSMRFFLYNLGANFVKRFPAISAWRPVVLVRQKLRGLIQGYGTPKSKRRLWDNEFSSGRWDCLDDMRADCLYPLLEFYADGRSVLDLGCGPGTTANEINARYTWYTGVDISEVALVKARRCPAASPGLCTAMLFGRFRHRPAVAVHVNKIST